MEASEVLDNQETIEHIELFKTWIGDHARGDHDEPPEPIPVPPLPETN